MPASLFYKKIITAKTYQEVILQHKFFWVNKYTTMMKQQLL